MSLQPTRLRLKEWLKSESLREKIKQDRSTAIQTLYSYLTLIYGENNWDEMPWIDVAMLFSQGIDANQATIEFPMFKGSGDESDPLPWEYPERDWYVWANTFASEYGWTLDYIAELEIDDAIGLMQEILTDDQLNKEWDWNLSELTYSYDEKTKQSIHKEYPRPKWMLPELKELPVTKIPKSMLPVGLVIGGPDDVKH